MDVARIPEHLLVAPEADLSHLSFCETDVTALAEWVNDLPMANTGETASRLLKATPELARVRTNYLTRFELLETLRPTLHYICARVDRGMISHPQNAETLARHAQELQRLLCGGYQAVVLSTLAVIDEDKSAREVMQTATHRALSDLSRVLLRSLKLYTVPPEGLWRDLNQLYGLAEAMSVEDQKVVDSENHAEHSISIREAYLRPVLLYAAQPNQLRQQDLNQLHNALEHWCERVHISTPGETALLHLDLAADAGPRYAKVQGTDRDRRGVHTEVLAYEIEAYLREIESAVPIPDYVDQRLLRHVADCWGTVHTRDFTRIPSRSDVKLAIGLRTSHFFTAGGTASEPDEPDEPKVKINPFLAPLSDADPKRPAPERDVWDQALRARIPENPYFSGSSILNKTQQVPVSATTARKKPQYLSYDTSAVDTSPKGYCLKWQENAPTNLQVGELIAVQEEDDPAWAIATLRWLQKDRHGGLKTGLELLSPRAVPALARVVRTKSGATEFTRALLLPALPTINQPETLITPRLPFQAQQKVQIQYDDKQITAHLDGCLRSTENFNQFTFRVLGSYLEKPTSRRNMAS